MLTAAQLQTFKTAILADATLGPLFSAPTYSTDTAFLIAAAFNQPATPDFWVWRTRVTQDEIMLNGFDWTRVDNLSVGTARVWEWMFDNQDRVIDASKANIRAGIDATWKGTAADLAVRAVVYSHCQRLATRAEKLFATGAGTSVSNGVGPATMAFEGAVSYQDVDTAHNL